MGSASGFTGVRLKELGCPHGSCKSFVIGVMAQSPARNQNVDNPTVWS